MNQPAVEFNVSRPIPPFEPNTADLVLRFTMPLPVNPAPRQPLNLALVLDRSGSMAGPALKLAKRAAQHAVRQLGPEDRVSIVAFDSTVEVVVPSTAVTQAETIVQAIEHLRSGNSTALYAGWVAGMQEVQSQRHHYSLNRVLLLTDGLANVGPRNPDALASQVAQALGTSVSTSVIGLGNHYNEVLLETLALSGDGNYTYVEEPSQLEAVFTAELTGLQSMVGQQVSLGVEPEAGLSVMEVWNDFPRTSTGRLKLPHLRAGQPIEVALRVRTAGIQGQGRTLRLRLAWTDVVSGQRLRYRSAVTLPPLAAVPFLPAVASLVTSLQLARLKEQAVRATERGDMLGAAQSWQQAEGTIRSGLSSGLSLQDDDLALQQVRDRLAHGDQASASKLARAQNYTRRQSKGQTKS
ncbi:hypothetical protein DKM44_14410 [Deinococcus irradiatisoli]|uniref:VWFA domain-containing protein n=1 Tax=Deinococcus irradiatisoli TaxID=2202254 RepID=A0A2Z3JUS0_9DEIO|nr:VWA domain-containing protein [Deinococcus irradiatisoli]AWN24274.1 hypothetical protein DKM44_14410 [Deinococcus irradiatisoli]